MQGAQITTIDNENENCTPLIFGDMNATTSAHDRTSTNKSIAEKCTKNSFRTTTYPHCPTTCLLIQTHLNHDPGPSHGLLTGKDSVRNITYSFSRIDDILFSTALANTCKPSYTCDLGHLSDHVPLLAIVRTCTLNLRIPHIVKAQAKKAAKQATLTCPACQRFRPINIYTCPF